MKLYMTKAPAKLGASAQAQNDQVLIQLYRVNPDSPVSFTQDLPERNVVTLGQPIVIDRGLIEARISEREFSECTHVYVIASTLDGSLLRVRNKLVETYFTKNSGAHYNAMLAPDEFIAAQVYIPFADSPTEDWSVRVNADPGIKAEATGDVGTVDATHEALGSFSRACYPSIRVLGTQAQADGSIAITAQLMFQGQALARSGTRIFVKSVTGHINRREVRTDANGQVTVLARKLDIPADEPMTVEFGFKYFSNMERVDV